MWPRSQTSGLMIGEWTRLELPVAQIRDEREGALACLFQRREHSLGVGGEVVGWFRAGCHQRAVLANCRT